MRITWRGYAALFRRSFVAAIEDNFVGIAKAAAYSALLSFFPLLTSAATILVQVKAGYFARIIAQFLFQVVPPGTEDVVRYQFTVRGQRPVTLLVMAALLSVIAASGVVSSLMQGFDSAYRITRRPSMLRNWLVSILLVLMATLPLLVACVVILFGGVLDRLAMDLFSINPHRTGWWTLLSRLARYIVSFSAMVAVTMILYYFGPYRKQRWSGVWRGAVVTTVLSLLATEGFGWYVRHLANYNVLYGGIATSIALLVWMYLMSFIALFGCEFNAEYERETSGPGL